jgi:hypothetical protein
VYLGSLGNLGYEEQMWCYLQRRGSRAHLEFSSWGLDRLLPRLLDIELRLVNPLAPSIYTLGSVDIGEHLPQLSAEFWPWLKRLALAVRKGMQEAVSR